MATLDTAAPRRALCAALSPHGWAHRAGVRRTKRLCAPCTPSGLSTACRRLWTRHRGPSGGKREHGVSAGREPRLGLARWAELGHKDQSQCPQTGTLGSCTAPRARRKAEVRLLKSSTHPQAKGIPSWLFKALLSAFGIPVAPQSSIDSCQLFLNLPPLLFQVLRETEHRALENSSGLSRLTE